jgi:hypothetical protein
MAAIASTSCAAIMRCGVASIRGVGKRVTPRDHCLRREWFGADRATPGQAARSRCCVLVVRVAKPKPQPMPTATAHPADQGGVNKIRADLRPGDGEPRGPYEGGLTVSLSQSLHLPRRAAAAEAAGAFSEVEDLRCRPPAGEAGIGKSRLTAALMERLANPTRACATSVLHSTPTALFIRSSVRWSAQPDCRPSRRGGRIGAGWRDQGANARTCSAR